MSVSAILTFLGGVGLFLLGMRLMTDGLTSAAGSTLRVILTSATRSRARAIASGIGITAVVQSSGAVIFATVGFVNASLLSLGQAIGIIFGSNIGTTFTSWIVALIGFNLDLQALAMPAIGIGMTLSVTAGARRYGALGRALAGFGLFFLGIDVLRGAFEGVGDVVALEEWAGQGVLSLLLFLFIGALLTTLMQSSSATLALTITATAGGLIPLPAAAAMVIGANVGTTSLGLFAALGATAPAKRAAMAHVLFNAVTGCVAFVLLPALLWLVNEMAELMGSAENLAMSLAIFHSLVNLLGLVIMWPLANKLEAFLQRRFKSALEDVSKPQFLDSNVQRTPSFALDALAQELYRMNRIACASATATISSEKAHREVLDEEHQALENLSFEIGDFASGISRAGMKAEQIAAIPDAQRVAQYLVNVVEHARNLASMHTIEQLRDEQLMAARNGLRAQVVDLLERATGVGPEWDATAFEESRAAFETEYQIVKAAFLTAGTNGLLVPRVMASALERLSELRRIADQGSKAAVYLDRYIRNTKVILATPEELTIQPAGEPSVYEASERLNETI